VSATSGGAGQVVVFGSLNADLTVRVERFPQPGETLSGSELVTAPGGKSSNQAVAAATLGAQVRLIGAVGDDANGAFLLDQVSHSGVDVAGVMRDPDHATGSAMIVVDAAGENTIIVSPGANGAVSDDSLTAQKFAGADIVCLCLEVPLAAVQAAAEKGREAGAQVLLNLSPYADVPDALLSHVDVLLVNKSEAELVLSRSDIADDWDGALDGFVALGVHRVVVTLGADGAVVLDGTASSSDGTASSSDGTTSQNGDNDAGQVTTIDSPKVNVVDTTGCGDAFTGALAHGMAKGASLVEASKHAAEAGALAATREGAQSSYQAFAHLS